MQVNKGTLLFFSYDFYFFWLVSVLKKNGKDIKNSFSLALQLFEQDHSCLVWLWKRLTFHIFACY